MLYFNCNKLGALTVVIIVAIIAYLKGDYSDIENKDNSSNTKVTITVLDVVSVYRVASKYNFFIPKVDPQCECTCGGKFQECSESTRKDHQHCGSFSNTTSTCTVYNDEGTDPKICPNEYHVCCTVYLTKNLFLDDYVAVQLKYDRTEYKLKVSVENSSGGFNETTFFVRNGMEKIILSQDTIVQFFLLPSINSINESWYFSSINSSVLLVTSKLNNISSSNLLHLGWFRHVDELISRINVPTFKPHFKIHLIKCESKPPTFTWKFNATGYSDEDGHFHFPSDAARLIDRNEEVSRATLDLSNKIVLIKQKEKYHPIINASLVKVNSTFNDRRFMFYSIITLSNNVHKLNLKFIQGSGSFIVNISFPYSIRIESFSLTIKNASTLHPFTYERIIKMDSAELPRICVQQPETVLCQSAKFNSTSFFHVLNSDEILAENGRNNRCTEIINMQNCSWIENYSSILLRLLICSSVVNLIIVIDLIQFLTRSKSLVKWVYERLSRWRNNRKNDREPGNFQMNEMRS